ncbi:MAG: inorganic diphosphatase [Gemmatimonadaceae bacterium]
MHDRGDPDDKILAVPVHDPYYEEFFAIADIPQHVLREIEYFFCNVQNARRQNGRDQGMG